MISYKQLDSFVSAHVTGRKTSMFAEDLSSCKADLSNSIARSKCLVIGGAGSIGSAYIRQLAAFNPSEIVVVDISENGLAELVRNLRNDPLLHAINLRTYPFDFGSELFFRWLDRETTFDHISIFAALKHVRTERDRFTSEALLRSNFINILKLLEWARTHPPQSFFSVSTDKAAYPVSLMGASKRLMEMALQAYASELNTSAARFANVAFSAGSLLDSFVHRFARKQALAAPTDIKRYFITAEEAGELCLMSSALKGTCTVLVPALGRHKLVGFDSIALRFCEVFGQGSRIFQNEEQARRYADKFNEKTDPYPVYLFQTYTSGEKSEEQFYTREEAPDWGPFNSVGLIRPASQHSPVEILKLGAELEKFLTTSHEKSDLLQFVMDALPDFEHKETGRSLDHHM